MADFCLQCNLDLYFGPYSDFDGMGDPPPGKGWLVLCEGCGPTVVDGRGMCIAADCRDHSPAMIPSVRSEVYERAARWVARRSGPLGPLLRLRDRFLGTPWEPGHIHFSPFWVMVRQVWSDLKSGETEAERVLWNTSQGAPHDDPYSFNWIKLPGDPE